MNRERRHFLKMAGYGLGSTALASMIHQMSLTSALAGGSSGYKALVCVFLAGGNDGNNTLIPLGPASDPTGGYPAYMNTRKLQSAGGLAFPQSALLPISPPSMPNPFGLNPNLADLQNLFNSGHLAVVCGVGPLVQYLDRTTYLNGSVTKPFQLFSHSDQIGQWQTARADIHSPTGWGGRIADIFAEPTIPMITSVAGDPLYTIGATRRPLGIQPHPTLLKNVLLLGGYGTSAMEVARRQAFDTLRGQNRDQALINAASNVTDEALAVAGYFNVDDPTFNTVFPSTTLGNQLHQVAKIIKLNQSGGFNLATQQIFFCQFGSFDTHQNELTTQANLLKQLNDALIAFYNATVELGLSANVTTFTLSDFSRTFQPSGSGTIVGTDHAWANHHFVVGDSVAGGDLYGVPLPSTSGGNGTVYPTLQLGGPYDSDPANNARGRWIPTVAVEQYAATLAKWYGLSDADIGNVFPALGMSPPTFSPSDLGFMMKS
jgi:uncharacterized protein (DUF1501 family)